MSEVAQMGWTRIFTRTGRYEYQFQGRSPAVRNGRYEDAADYQFLVMDEEGWLYKIPVRMAAAVEAEIERAQAASVSAPLDAPQAQGGQPQSPLPEKSTALRIAEAQLRAGLEEYRPQQNVPYGDLDASFAVNVERARELAERA